MPNQANLQQLHVVELHPLMKPLVKSLTKCPVPIYLNFGSSFVHSIACRFTVANCCSKTSLYLLQCFSCTLVLLLPQDVTGRPYHRVNIYPYPCHPKETVEPELVILKPAMHATLLLLHSYQP
jgi:hypothetical protein